MFLVLTAVFTSIFVGLYTYKKVQVEYPIHYRQVDGCMMQESV